MWLFTGFVVLALISIAGAIIPRPRGVSISMASFYIEKVKFHCLDNSLAIPYNYINDDYCDCPDGSDEPGTSACLNGKFHCTNAGYIPGNVPSSRVNDGYCDCCDGTDEYDGTIMCQNNCKELGKKAREDQMKIQQMQQEGFKKKQECIQEGLQAKEEKKGRLEQLENGRVEAESAKNEAEALKNEKEAPEKLAKETHEKAWEEEKARRQAEQERKKAEEAFIELDFNKDQLVNVQEMVLHLEFDIDSDGVVSVDEAKEYMEDVEEANFDHFYEKMWPNIKEIFKKLKETSADLQESVTTEASTSDTVPHDSLPPSDHVSPPTIAVTSSPTDDDDDDDDDDEDVDDEDVDDDVDEKEEFEDRPKETKKVEEADQMPEYDEETKNLIKSADEVRERFQAAESKLKGIDDEISNLKKFLELDLGPDNEFYTLHGRCFDFTDREYTYTLCPFDKATQRSKSGGMETSLGIWGHWDGLPDDRYAAQKYERGQNCWNGPDRSVKVHFECGIENQLTGSFEPNRCEYSFSFATPARCSQPKDQPQSHDEL